MSKNWSWINCDSYIDVNREVWGDLVSLSIGSLLKNDVGDDVDEGGRDEAKDGDEANEWYGPALNDGDASSDGDTSSKWNSLSDIDASGDGCDEGVESNLSDGRTVVSISVWTVEFKIGRWYITFNFEYIHVLASVLAYKSDNPMYFKT